MLADAIHNIRICINRCVCAFLVPRKYEQEQARLNLNSEVKTHWKAYSIDPYELVYERWKSETEFSSDKENDSFIVFIDVNFDVDWLTRDAADPTPGSEVSEAIADAEAAGARRCKHLPKDQLLEYRQILGQAIVSAIEDNVEKSKQLVRDALEFHRDRSIEQSRKWTLTYAHTFVPILSLIVIVIFNEIITTFPDDTRTLILGLWASIHAATLGAYLSLLLGTGSGRCDSAAGKSLHLVEALTKLISGSLVGAVACILVKSPIAPKIMGSLADDFLSLAIFGFAAGFIERLIPRIISNYSNNIIERTQE